MLHPASMRHLFAAQLLLLFLACEGPAIPDSSCAACALLLLVVGLVLRPPPRNDSCATPGHLRVVVVDYHGHSLGLVPLAGEGQVVVERVYVYALVLRG